MRKFNYLFILLITTYIGTSFTSCEQDECEVCTEIPTDIRDYENTIIIRFKIPSDSKDVSITLSGKLISYDEYDADGAPLKTNLNIQEFAIENKDVSGHYRNIMAGGEPVPGAEIIIEQEPYDDPVIKTTINSDDGSFKITLEKLSPGTYQVRVAPSDSITTKGGFAIGGFNAT